MDECFLIYQCNSYSYSKVIINIPKLRIQYCIQKLKNINIDVELVSNKYNFGENLPTIFYSNYSQFDKDAIKSSLLHYQQKSKVHFIDLTKNKLFNQLTFSQIDFVYTFTICTFYIIYSPMTIC